MSVSGKAAAAATAGVSARGLGAVALSIDRKAVRNTALALALAATTAALAACARETASSNSGAGAGAGAGTLALQPDSRRVYDPKYGTSSSPRLYTDLQQIPKGGGSYKIGSPYKVAERWYFPAEDRNYDRQGMASWYGTDFHGRKTANGEVFDMNALTAAHPTLPLPAYAYVTNLANDRTVLVRINDRGPYAHDRVMDLSRQTARLLGSEGVGLTKVRVRFAGRAPLDGNDYYERQFLARQPWAAQAMAARNVGSSPRMGLGQASGVPGVDR